MDKLKSQTLSEEQCNTLLNLGLDMTNGSFVIIHCADGIGVMPAWKNFTSSIGKDTLPIVVCYTYGLMDILSMLPAYKLQRNSDAVYLEISNYSLFADDELTVAFEMLKYCLEHHLINTNGKN